MFCGVLVLAAAERHPVHSKTSSTALRKPDSLSPHTRFREKVAIWSYISVGIWAVLARPHSKAIRQCPGALRAFLCIPTSTLYTLIDYNISERAPGTHKSLDLRQQNNLIFYKAQRYPLRPKISSNVLASLLFAN